jgi:hypothetical protein
MTDQATTNLPPLHRLWHLTLSIAKPAAILVLMVIAAKLLVWFSPWM